jgi:hypothetical protein
MGNDWLQAGENPAGSWSVYIGEEGPMAAKVTGKLHITDRNVHFEAGLSLEKNAAALISNNPHIKAFEKSEEHLTIPFSEIAGGEIVKKGFLLKTLVVKLKAGGALAFHFGAMNPQKALDALNAGLKT